MENTKKKQTYRQICSICIVYMCTYLEKLGKTLLYFLYITVSCCSELLAADTHW